MSMFIALSVAAAMMAQDPPARPAPSTDPATRLSDVEVVGQRTEQQARAFVEEVSSPPNGTRPARWNTGICPSVTGMRADMAQYMIDRIARTALDAGAEIEGPGCEPNVIILATDNGRQLAADLVSGARRGFRPSPYGGASLNRAALVDFQATTAPVRWWHVNQMIEPNSGTVIVNQPGDDPQTIEVHDASRMRSNVRYDLAWVIIILDMSRMEGVQFGALSDYVAMVTLTQVDPNLDVSGTDSILNLFDGGYDNAGLSSWDRDFLSAMYSIPDNRATARQQTRMLTYNLVNARQDVAEDGETAQEDSAEAQRPQP